MSGFFAAYIYSSFGGAHIGAGYSQFFHFMTVVVLTPILLICLHILYLSYQGLISEIKRDNEKQRKTKIIKLKSKSVELLDTQENNVIIQDVVC